MGKPTEEVDLRKFDLRIKSEGDRAEVLNKIIIAKKKLGNYATFAAAGAALILEHCDLMDVCDDEPTKTKRNGKR